MALLPAMTPLPSSVPDEMSLAPPSPKTPQNPPIDPDTCFLSAVAGPPPSNRPFLEDILGQMGYTVHETIATSENGGDLHARYAKVTKDGQTMLVDLDEDGSVSVDGKVNEYRSHIHPASHPSISSLYHRYSQLDSKDMAISLECRNGLCVIEPKSAMADVLYPKSADHESNQSVRLDGVPIAYPVVPLSRIQRQGLPPQIGERLRQARSLEYQDCQQHLAEAGNVLVDLTQTYKAFFSQQEVVFNQLGQTINELETIVKQYHTQGDTSSERYHLTTYNLRLRHDLLTDLLRDCQEVTCWTQFLKERKERLMTFTSALSREQERLGKIIHP